MNPRDWLSKNKQWLFSGIAGVVLGTVFTLIGTLIDNWLHKEQLRKEGISIAVSYRNTIKSITTNLSKVKRDFSGTSKILVSLDKVYDFRREDWFDVHRNLSNRLNRLHDIDEKDGRQANEEIIRFFNDLKYTRELYAFTILLTKRSANTDAPAELLMEVINEYSKKLDEELDKLILLGEQTVVTLGRLIS